MTLRLPQHVLFVVNDVLCALVSLYVHLCIDERTITCVHVMQAEKEETVSQCVKAINDLSG